MALEMACVYYDNQKCKKFEEPGYVSWCVLGPCAHQTPSNADRIRAMRDEELAKGMLQLVDLDDRIRYCKDLPECQKALDDDVEIPADRCKSCLLSWLQQPAEEVTQ